MDATIAALDSHPNIEVRLFNPFAHRQHRFPDYLGDFSRVNRRMHNKSMTADNQVAIVGGRNIGNEYFAAGEGVAFADLDVAAMGSVPREVSAEFDLYWASESAYPADRLVEKADAAMVAALLEQFKTTRASPEAQQYIEAIKASTFIAHLRAGDLPLEWCSAQVHYDDPAKVLHPPEVMDYRMGPRLRAAMGQPVRSLDIISP
jgi:putative cardiolipin synthase